MSDPKVHHFVPRSYLRRFADHHERLAVRTRQRGSYVTSIDNVMARSGLYKVPGVPLTTEYTLGSFESLASVAIDEVCQGSLPPAGSPSRQALTLFMALQLARTPDALEVASFGSDVAAAVGPLPIDEPTMRSYLSKLYGFEPLEPEVGAACDLANYQPGGYPVPTANEVKAFKLEAMFQTSLNSTAPVLAARAWSLEAPREPNLITSDRPVTLWNPAGPEDAHSGVGIVDTEEIWFPVDPERMLVLRRGGPERTKRIGPDRVRFVNNHMARHCTSEIVSHPNASERIAEIPLAKRRPTIRFWRGPAVDESGSPLDGEMLQLWRPIRDIPDVVATRG